MNFNVNEFFFCFLFFSYRLTKANAEKFSKAIESIYNNLLEIHNKAKENVSAEFETSVSKFEKTSSTVEIPKDHFSLSAESQKNEPIVLKLNLRTSTITSNSINSSSPKLISITSDSVTSTTLFESLSDQSTVTSISSSPPSMTSINSIRSTVMSEAEKMKIQSSLARVLRKKSTAKSPLASSSPILTVKMAKKSTVIFQDKGIKMPNFVIKYKNEDARNQQKSNSSIKHIIMKNKPIIEGEKIIDKKIDLTDELSPPPKKIKLENEEITEISENVSGNHENFLQSEIKIEPEEIQEISPYKQPIIAHTKRVMVSHMSYHITNGIISFNCKICNIDYSTIEKFCNHLREAHFQNRWFGNCFACLKKLESKGDILEELLHLFFGHAVNENLSMITNGELYTNRIKQAELKEKILEYQQLAVKKKKQLPLPPMISFPQLFVVCPWQSKRFTKGPRSKIGIKSVLFSEMYLSCLFKCMDTKCDYYGNDENAFEKHLQLHDDDQKSQFRKYCSYCVFSTENTKDLIYHIVGVHLHENLQCKFCFGRKNDAILAKNHAQQLHADKHNSNSPTDSFFVIKSSDYMSPGILEIDKHIWKTKTVSVPMISCMCKLKLKKLN
jgi:hypothetical protein